MARRPASALVVVLAVLVLGACDGGGSGSGSVSVSGSASGSGTHAGSGSGAGAGGECVSEGATKDDAVSDLNVVLDEWEVRPQPATGTAGVVEVVARNDGEEPHELVIVKAGIDALVVKDGAVQEDDLPDGAFIGEIEEFAAGKKCEAHFELDAGTYALFCNIVEREADGAVESHYENGMVTTFEVK